MLKSESTMPQYQVVRMGQGDSSPEGRIEGQEPVEVRTPARRAACVGVRDGGMKARRREGKSR